MTHLKFSRRLHLFGRSYICGADICALGMEPTESTPRLALPERAVAGVAEGVDLRVAVVADALHAFGQAVFVLLDVSI